MGGEDKKESVKKAMESYLNRALKQPKPRAKKNQAPEKEVERQVVVFLRAQGFSINVIDSKATYNKQAGMYLKSMAIPGFPDIVGCDPNGFATFIELKAPGRISTSSFRQVAFLADKIRTKAFGCVTDSVDRLTQIYTTWLNLRGMGQVKEAQDFLLSKLPKADSF